MQKVFSSILVLGLLGSSFAVADDHSGESCPAGAAACDPLMADLINERIAAVNAREADLEKLEKALDTAVAWRNGAMNVGVPVSLLGSGVAFFGAYTLKTKMSGWDSVFGQFFGSAMIVAGGSAAAAGLVTIQTTQKDLKRLKDRLPEVKEALAKDKLMLRKLQSRAGCH